MHNIESYNFSGKKAIIRVDFNVPLNKNKEITDDTRIRASLPTIERVLATGGSVILMSHLGRPENGPEEKYSMRPLVAPLAKLLNREVKFADDCIGESAVRMSAELKAGEVLMLENLRFYKEESKGKVEFAQKLAALADCYINDAFGTAHRAHASTTIIADSFPNDSMFGYLIDGELTAMDNVLYNAKHPFTAILGGAKVSTKITIINRMLERVDNILIGGGMTYTFIKAMGGNIGNSLVEEDLLDVARDVLKQAAAKGVKIYLPVDQLLADKFDNAANTKVTAINDGEENWLGVDIGKETIKLYCDVIKNSATILWNGPMGVFEMDNFKAGTVEVALSIAEATKNGAYSLVGGGDSVAAINQFNLADKVSYVSTGGGAMLEYLEGLVLPGIKAIRGK